VSRKAVTLEAVSVQESRVTDVLCCAGACFALLHGSRARGNACPGSDLDAAAWWGDAPPVAAWSED
jgi:hypothetical protein